MYQDTKILMTDADFSFIKKEVYNVCGIVLGDHKKQMVYSRLSRRLRTLNLSSFVDYIHYLQTNRHQEMSEFINCITTNLTSFFREFHHFEFLRDQVLPSLVSRFSADKRRIRIWSAGCSTGEEPYSIVMTAMEALNGRNADFKLLATDLDSDVLSKAARGVYKQEAVDSLDVDFAAQWFSPVKSEGDFGAPMAAVSPDLQRFISFKRLNLLEPWPMKGPFDVIFCRNVLIYFDQKTKDRLFDRYAQLLAPGGYLFIGHSESMSRGNTHFKPLGQTMYQKGDL